MKQIAFGTLIAIISLTTTAPSVLAAGKIHRACMSSDRPAANRRLCSCIQDAADMVLTNRDQALAAKFFRDPQMAQDIRQSDRASHEAFWQRYKSFGKAAQAFCR
ncbi:MAG TPA: hypothetical protein ENJ91_05585 [Rhodobacteraceae bacterium]|nr:hypothetical protein [Paracoccaceae bacterium]